MGTSGTEDISFLAFRVLTAAFQRTFPFIDWMLCAFQLSTDWVLSVAQL